MRKLIIHCPADNSAWVKLDHAPRAEHSMRMAIAKTHTVLNRGRVLDYNGFVLGRNDDDTCLLLGEGGERTFSDSWTAAEWFVRNA